MERAMCTWIEHDTRLDNRNTPGYNSWALVELRSENNLALETLLPLIPPLIVNKSANKAHKKEFRGQDQLNMCSRHDLITD